MAKIIKNKSICPITMEKIEKDAFYMSCRICHTNYNSSPLKLWIQLNNNCPICRTQWIILENLEIIEYRNCKKKNKNLLAYIYMAVNAFEQMCNIIPIININHVTSITNFFKFLCINIEMGIYDNTFVAAKKIYIKT